MGATGTYRSKPSHAGNQDGEDQTATLMQESLRISLVGLPVLSPTSLLVQGTSTGTILYSGRMLLY